MKVNSVFLYEKEDMNIEGNWDNPEFRKYYQKKRYKLLRDKNPEKYREYEKLKKREYRNRKKYEINLIDPFIFHIKHF